MAEQREQSYYEIALTNRQVMSIFVVLLVSLLVAFTSGVWIGRDNGGAVQVASAERITADRAAGEEPLESMNFFSERPAGGAVDTAGLAAEAPVERRPAAAKPSPPAQSKPPAGANAKAADTPAAAEPVGRAEPDPEPAAGQSPDTVGEAESTELVADRTPEDAIPATMEPAEPELRETAADASALPPAIEDTAAAEVAAPESGGFFVQVFSSNDEVQATSLVERLRGGGYAAFLSPAEVSGRAMYRVRVGPYLERDEAEQVADRVRTSFKLNTWITR